MGLKSICLAVALAIQGTTAQSLDWDAAYAKAIAALSQLTLEEKVGIVSGSGWGAGTCVGNTYPAATIGFPALCLQDGPLGVRVATNITAFTPGVQAASTWDLNLIRQRGQFLGEEAKALGVQVMLGPCTGPLGKVAEGGRNWEGFSVDPYLSGEAIRETTLGMQGSGVQATAKHWILNEQERNRQTMSSDADDRTVHELYVWPFMDAVKADTTAFMCSYNRVDGTYACESSYVMETLLKEQLGFRGYVMTDWGGSSKTTEPANAGLDMMMPGSAFNSTSGPWGARLVAAVNSGAVPQARVDDMVKRVLAGWYLLNQDQSYPTVDLTRNVQGNHKTNVRAVARDGLVLLKNDASTLPLTAAKNQQIAVIGTGAFSGGALGMGTGSGSATYPYFIAPFDAMSAKASSTGATIIQSNSDNAQQGVAAAQAADTAFVFITATGGEGSDRSNLDPQKNGNALVQAVAAVNPNVIVVAHSIGPLILESILSNPSVKAVVWAGLPSSESGNALVDVLWGDFSPSGKLVYTIARSAADYGTSSVPGDDTFPEGLYIDYRHFDQAGISPRYEFGFGLSYTDFTYSSLSTSSVSATSGPATGEVAPGGPVDLWDTVATVTATITNSGEVQGAEVAQLYLSLPSTAPASPPRQLRGFDKLNLAPGASGSATFLLTRRDLSYWDVESKMWVLPPGEFVVSVGASSRDLRLVGSLTVN